MVVPFSFCPQSFPASGSDGDTASEEWLMKFSGAGFGDGGRGPQIKEYESLESLLESEKVKEVDSALKLPDKCAALTVF